MLAADNIGIEFAGRILFRNLSFTVRPGDRVSLAGPNGSGKSSLLKVLCNLEHPSSGRIIKARSTEVGYLPQDGVNHAGKTLYQEVERSFTAVLALQDELDRLGSRMEELDPRSREYGDVLEEFGELQLRLENHDPARMRPKIERVLAGLGFPGADFDRPTSEFSGGWQMRIALAKLLLSEPEILLLDEPTNHLDIESVTWLEQYLKQYPGAIILISHDLALLDALTNKTFAFENAQVNAYSGNYSFYLQERIARREQLERAYANQQREIDKAQQLINRFRAKASKASMVQSRIKQLEKIERIELEAAGPEVSFRFPQPPPSGHRVLELKAISKAYNPQKPVFADLDFTVEKGDRIAIVGVNGAGKSTFSRIAAGEESFDSGTRHEGHNVVTGYFSQDHADALGTKRTVLEAAEEGLRGEAAAEIRNILGCFLFRGDDVFKSVDVLSGGERGRLALVKILSQPANFLILDEPTNHLDMQSQVVLQNALADYTGTYMIVSHDRRFLDPIVDKVLEFRVGLPPRLHLGNISDFLEKKRAEEALTAAKPPRRQPLNPVAPESDDDATPPSKPTGKGRKERKKIEGRIRQERAAMLQPLQSELAAIEEKIAACETDKAELVASMSDPQTAGDAERAREIGERFQCVTREIESGYTAWDTLSEKIERIEIEFTRRLEDA
jgi:ATP-binding cassette subfamily F protein 3